MSQSVSTAVQIFWPMNYSDYDILTVMTLRKLISGHPIRAILVICALVLIAGGAYIITPWYVSEANPVSDAVPERVLQIVIGLLYIWPAVTTILGIRWNKITWMSKGSFGMALALVFSGILRALVFGWVPLTWLAIVALGLICGVCYLKVRQVVITGAW